METKIDNKNNHLQQSDEKGTQDAWVEIIVMVAMLAVGFFIFGWLWLVAGATGIKAATNKSYKTWQRALCFVLALLCFGGYLMVKIASVGHRY
ncbi:MAG: hypothetical protein ACI4AH_00745 [Muribaculaceae bacterium]